MRLATELSRLGEQCLVSAPISNNGYLHQLPQSCLFNIEFSQKLYNHRTAAVLNRPLTQFRTLGHSFDIIHQTYYQRTNISFPNSRRILTVYDMIHELFPNSFKSSDKTTIRKRNAIEKSDHIICISQSTKNDLCNHYQLPEDKISVVHLAHDCAEVVSDLNDSFLEKQQPFILYVGERGGYKNFKSLLEAVSTETNIKNNFKIIAFGGGPFNIQEHEMIKKFGYNDGIVRQISGDDGKLAELYSTAAALVYPSIYEGFGLPPLEAMSYNCPVVLSNTSSMPEVVGNAGEFFDPYEIEDLACSLSRVIFDTERRDQLIEYGKQRCKEYSWQRCAHETRSVYSEQLAK